MKTRVLGLLLVIAMVSAFAGCNNVNNQNTPGNTTGGSQNTQKSTEVAENFNLEGYPIVNEKITLSVMWSHRDIDTLADYHEMRCNQELEELTNIHADVEMVTGSNFNTKLNLMFASGDYVDIIIAGQGIDYEEYGVTQKLILPTDDLIDKFMPIYKNRAESETSDALMGLRASDGKLYSVASRGAGMAINTVTQFFINKPWLDKLGLQIPSTLEDLTEVLRAFKTQDPNGNGKADEIPFTLRFESDTSSVDSVLSLFGIPKTIWSSADAKNLYIDNDRKVQFVGTQQGFRDCMEWLHMLYVEGLVDQEMLTQDMDMMETKISDGLVGFFGYWRLLNMPITDWAKDNAVFMNPVTVQGYDICMPTTMGVAEGGAYITIANKHVPESCRWLDAQLETEMMFNMTYGFVDQGDDGWIYNEDGLIETLDVGGDKTVIYNMGVNSLFFAPGDYYYSVYKMAPHRAEKLEYVKKYEAEGFLQKFSNDMLKLAPRTSEEIARCTLLQTDINNAVTEYTANFIAKGVTDDSWNTFVSIINDMHIEEYISIYQKALDNFKD